MDRLWMWWLLGFALALATVAPMLTIVTEGSYLITMTSIVGALLLTAAALRALGSDG